MKLSFFFKSMLLPTMSNREITQEIARDYEIITGSSTLWRLMDEYHKKRKKLKIKGEEDYTVYREIKTKSKNNWLVKLSKKQNVKKHKSAEDTFTALFTWYYTSIGIRFFFRTETGTISVFNGHLLTRYRERMNLEINLHLDLFKRLFKNNKDWNYWILPREDNKQKFIGILKEGFVLGDILIDGEGLLWLVHKTFISRDTAGLRLTSTSTEMLELMQNNLVKAHPENDPELYKDLVKLYQDFGLMDENGFNQDPEALMREIVKKVQQKNMPETDFWVLV